MRKKTDYRRDAKMLAIDLEVSPNLGWFYGQYDTTPLKIEQPPILLAVSWKWLGDKGKAQGKILTDFKQSGKYDDYGIVRKLWELLDEAQLVYAHNGNKFDLKMANAFFIRHNMTPPSPYKSFDTLQTARKYFKFDNNKLDYLGKLLVGEGKTEITYGACWDKLLHGTLKEQKKYGELMRKYCLTPDHKVLGTDLRWHTIGSLQIGDTILGFDENPHQDGATGRRYKKSTVLGNDRQIEDVYEVELSNGDKIKCTAEHKWLCSTYSKKQLENNKRISLSGGQIWKKTSELVFNGKRLDGLTSTSRNESSATMIQKYLNVWDIENSREAGWLAGMFDGEGSLYNRKLIKGQKFTGGFAANICQKVGLESDKIDNLIEKYGGVTHRQVRNPKENKLSTIECVVHTVCGKFYEKLEFLGKIYPERLIRKINWDNLPRLEGRKELVYVKNIKYLGKQEVVVLETDTHTYIADGYAMHNCNNDVDILEKVYYKLLPWATNHPNMALYAEQELICPRCANSTDFKVKSYRRTGVQVNAIQYQCKHCGAYITRKLEKEERETLKEEGRYSSVFRNVV